MLRSSISVSADQPGGGNAWKMIHAGATQDACHHVCMQRYLLHLAVADLATMAPPMRFHLADYEEGTAVCSLPAQAHGRSYLNLRLSIAMAGLMRSYGRCLSTDHRPGYTQIQITTEHAGRRRRRGADSPVLIG